MSITQAGEGRGAVAIFLAFLVMGLGFFPSGLQAGSDERLPARLATSHLSPATLRYEGRSRDSSGALRNGVFDVVLRFLDPETGVEVMLENHKSVKISNGSFVVIIGTGSAEDGPGPRHYASSDAMFRDYPDLLSKSNWTARFRRLGSGLNPRDIQQERDT